MENLKRQATEREMEIFAYLNDLRDSGITNMFGASPYLVEMYGLSKSEARKYLALWSKNFTADCDYKFIID